MGPPVELGVHRAPRCEPVVSQEQESPTCAPDRPSKILLVQVGGTLSVGCLSSSPKRPSALCVPSKIPTYLMLEN